MKILHLWMGDSPARGGGGAGSMARLHANLRRAGVDSRILCEHKTTDDPHVLLKPTQSRLETQIQRVTSRLGLNDIHRISSFSLRHHPAVQEADVLNFHGIHTGFISYLALPGLTAEKPGVFTLRDLWPLTGHCATPLGCERWKTGCGRCPHPQAYPPVKRDATRIEWKLKRWAYGGSNLVIVALSEWLAEQARQSMLSRFPIHTIPNGVDTQVFQPLDADVCRSLLGIPREKRVVMFAATNLNAPAKGGDLLLAAMRTLPEALKRDTVFLLMGSSGAAFAQAAGIRALDLGFLGNDRLKAIAYSAAELFVFPSRSETFGQVALESMACGTPVVACRVGPIPELVRDGMTGLVAEPEDPVALGRAVVRLLEDEALREHMGKRCRSVAVHEYPVALEAERYRELYRRCLHPQAEGAGRQARSEDRMPEGVV